MSQLSSFAKTIKIVKRPDGEAPEWVRDGWIGCTLTCLPECGHVPMYAEGLISGELEKVNGFSVPQDAALSALEHFLPGAATWFRENGFPTKGNFRFRFTEVEVIEHYSWEEISALHGHSVVYDDMETGTMRPMKF